MRILRITLVTLLLGPLGACMVNARGGAGTMPPPPPGEPGEPAPRAGIVEGTVVDAVTHEGLARTAIDLMHNGKPAGTAVTDATGHFRTGPLEPGDYQVRVRREQYNQVVQPHLEVHPGDNEMNAAMERHR